MSSTDRKDHKTPEPPTMATAASAVTSTTLTIQTLVDSVTAERVKTLKHFLQLIETARTKEHSSIVLFLALAKESPPDKFNAGVPEITAWVRSEFWPQYTPNINLDTLQREVKREHRATFLKAWSEHIRSGKPADDIKAETPTKLKDDLNRKQKREELGIPSLNETLEVLKKSLANPLEIIEPLQKLSEKLQGELEDIIKKNLTEKPNRELERILQKRQDEAIRELEEKEASLKRKPTEAAKEAKKAEIARNLKIESQKDIDRKEIDIEKAIQFISNETTSSLPDALQLRAILLAKEYLTKKSKEDTDFVQKIIDFFSFLQEQENYFAEQFPKYIGRLQWSTFIKDAENTIRNESVSNLIKLPLKLIQLRREVEELRRFQKMIEESDAKNSQLTEESPNQVLYKQLKHEYCKKLQSTQAAGLKVDDSKKLNADGIAAWVKSQIAALEKKVTEEEVVRWVRLKYGIKYDTTDKDMKSTFTKVTRKIEDKEDEIEGIKIDLHFLIQTPQKIIAKINTEFTSILSSLRETIQKNIDEKSTEKKLTRMNYKLTENGQLEHVGNYSDTTVTPLQNCQHKEIIKAAEEAGVNKYLALVDLRKILFEGNEPDSKKLIAFVEKFETIKKQIASSSSELFTPADPVDVFIRAIEQIIASKEVQNILKLQELAELRL